MTTTTRPASQKQFDFIKKLLAENELSPETLRFVEIQRGNATRGVLSSKAASGLIDLLMQQPRKVEAKEAPKGEATEGMHKVGDRIFKVQRAVHGSGNLYAKELVLVERDRVEIEDGVWHDFTAVQFEYAPGAMRLLSADTKMTLEEAKQFGALYGTCCACGRTLTNEDSIAAGIGPVCAGKF